MTYTEAFAELQTLVSEIEQGNITVDSLLEKVQRSSQLIQICKAKLYSTEEEVNKLLKDIGESNTIEKAT